MIKGAMKMEKELKKLKEKYNNSFDEINVIDVGYEYEEMRIEYRASFNDTNYKFYYNGDDLMIWTITEEKFILILLKK